MSGRPAAVTQANIARAIRAVEQTDARRVVEILPDGTIRIVPWDTRPDFHDRVTYPVHGADTPMDKDVIHPL